MPTPLGARTEWLHPNGPAERDCDPQGHHFAKTVYWEGATLVSQFRCEEISDVETRRWIEEESDGPALVQQTTFESVCFTRRFKRIEEED